MRASLRIALAATQAAIALSLACAHAPPAGEEARPAPAAEPQAAPAAAPPPVIVTGSRIPQRIDPCAGVPVTTDNVRIYCRQQILDTGRDTNVAAALQQLDPSVNTRP